jgi:hypothetical protein
MPNKGYNGADSFTFTVTNTSGLTSAPATVTIAVVPHFAGLAFISLPYDYPSASLDTVFGFAGVKMAVWNPLTLTYAITPNAPANSVRLGMGYWIRFPSSGAAVTTLGTPASVSADFPISLSKGWNQIGDPFLTSPEFADAHYVADGNTEAFDEAVLDGDLYGTVYKYDAASNRYVTTSSLYPGSGYWIYAFKAGDLMVPHP